MSFCSCYSEYVNTGQADKLLDHGGNRTRDLWFATSMLYQLSYEVKSVRMCDIVQLQFDICMYTAISIKVVSKKKEKVEYERERLIGKDYSFIPEYIIIHRFSTKFKIRSCFLMNINRNYVSLETKFCSVCVF